MNVKQKLHKANLQGWEAAIQTQVDSGLTIRERCNQNNVSFYAYNYQKHLLKEEYVDSCMPDIVQVSATPSVPSQYKAQLQTLKFSFKSKHIFFINASNSAQIA